MKYLLALWLLVVAQVSWSSSIVGSVSQFRPDTWARGGLLITIDGDLVGSSPCVFPDGTTNHFWIPQGSDLFDEFYALLWYAHTQRSRVRDPNGDFNILVHIIGNEVCDGDPPLLMEGGSLNTAAVKIVESHSYL